MKKHMFLGIAGIGLGVFLAGGFYYTAKRTTLFDSKIPTKVYSPSGEERVLNIPRYNLIKLPAVSCSGYVRRAAKDLFGVDYSIADAWDRRYSDQVVGPVDNSCLTDLAQNQQLTPGDIIGFYNPHSKHNEDLDKKGQKVRYTHVMVYLGLNENNSPLFAELYGEDTNVIGMREIERKGLEAREHICPKNRDEQLARK